MLAYVSWAEVKQQLCEDGRPQLANLFEEFFRRRHYKEDIERLLLDIAREDWGFDAVWDGTPPREPPGSDYEILSVEEIKDSNV